MLIEKVLETDVGIIKVVVIAHSKSCVLSISSDPLRLDPSLFWFRVWMYPEQRWA